MILALSPIHPDPFTFFPGSNYKRAIFYFWPQLIDLTGGKVNLDQIGQKSFFQHLSYCSQIGQQILSCPQTYSGPLWSFSPSHLSPVLPYHCHHHSHNHHSLVTIIILTFFTSLYWKNGQTSGQLRGFLVQPRHLQISHLGRSGAVWWW